MRLPLLLLTLLLANGILPAQNCTFDFDNEGWTADEDAVNGETVWQSAGGVSGGYILGVDASTGGTWHFVAPDKFRGIKCDAYGRYLRYDQYVSSNAAPNNRPDVELKGGGLTLVFNNPVLPGLSWTHYDILLRENAGWRLNTLTGAVPSETQFRQVLANITSLRIRGEYYSQADDQGGLDNVVLESNFTFAFDLDGDDSSGAIGGDFQGPAICTPRAPIVDQDMVLSTEARIDSIYITILNGGIQELLELNSLPGNILVKRLAPGKMVLVNTGAASPTDFLLLLQLIQYHDIGLSQASGIKVIQIQVFTDCGAVGETHRSFLPVFVQPLAGESGDTVLCYGSGPIDLRTVLGGNPSFDGTWSPPLHSGTNFFDPNVDTSGTYYYLIGEVTPCLGDTAQVRVKIHYPFQLRPDTTLCYDKTLLIRTPPGLVSWRWNDGTQKLQLPVTEPGTYTLVGETGYCTYSDSVAVDFITCEVCPPYPPNVFSPNDDGLNDGWHIFLPCRWSEFHLEVYDRWGSLVFAADDPETAWDGRILGRDAETGVYVWRMVWTGEYLGLPKTERLVGDVTIVR